MLGYTCLNKTDILLNAAERIAMVGEWQSLCQIYLNMTEMLKELHCRHFNKRLHPTEQLRFDPVVTNLQLMVFKNLLNSCWGEQKKSL